MFLPIHILWNVQIKLKQKREIIGIFWVRLLYDPSRRFYFRVILIAVFRVPIATVIELSALKRYFNSPDGTCKSSYTHFS